MAPVGAELSRVEDMTRAANGQNQRGCSGVTCEMRDERAGLWNFEVLETDSQPFCGDCQSVCACRTFSQGPHMQSWPAH